MKYTILFLTVALLHNTPLYSQYRKSISVKAGDDIAQAYSPNGFYRFAQFSNAALFNKSRKGSSGMLFNYNILTDKMQFIDKSGDTMDMINPTLFDSFVIEKTIFYFREDEGYMELVATAWPVRLVKKTTIKMKTETVGAYGTTSTTSAIDRMKTYIVGTNVYTYKTNENMIIKEMVDWFWIGENGRVLKATKKNLLPLLSPEKERAAEKYLSQTKIDFDSEPDLVKVLITLR